jgi:hypothetical protein
MLWNLSADSLAIRPDTQLRSAFGLPKHVHAGIGGFGEDASNIQERGRAPDDLAPCLEGALVPSLFNVATVRRRMRSLRNVSMTCLITSFTRGS